MEERGGRCVLKLTSKSISHHICGYSVALTFISFTTALSTFRKRSRVRLTSRIAASRDDSVGKTIGTVEDGAAARSRDVKMPISSDIYAYLNAKSSNRQKK